MPVPTITSITPDVGLSAGRTLVEIAGTNFRLPTPVVATTPRAAAYAKPNPSVSVTFGGRSARAVWVVSSSVIRCLTPRHPPNRTGPDGMPIIGTVDIAVQNLDDNADPIAGEHATLIDAYTFRRPRLDEPGTWQRAIEGFAESLREVLLENTVVNPPIDQTDELDSGYIQFAKLPGIGIFEMTFPQGERDNQARVEREAADGKVEIRRAPLRNDMQVRIVVLSNNIGELANLMEAFEHAFRDGFEVVVENPPDDPIIYSASFLQPLTIGSRIGNTDVMEAEGTIVVHNIESADMPGAPTDGLPDTLGATHHATREITRRLETVSIGRTRKT